jgi:hypothetical protein
MGFFPFSFSMCFIPLNPGLWSLEKDLFVTTQLQIGRPLVNVLKMYGDPPMLHLAVQWLTNRTAFRVLLNTVRRKPHFY